LFTTGAEPWIALVLSTAVLVLQALVGALWEGARPELVALGRATGRAVTARLRARLDRSK
jgi:hypothetical protein